MRVLWTSRGARTDAWCLAHLNIRVVHDGKMVIKDKLTMHGIQVTCKCNAAREEALPERHPRTFHIKEFFTKRHETTQTRHKESHGHKYRVKVRVSMARHYLATRAPSDSKGRFDKCHSY